MRFHCANGLLVLRVCAPQREYRRSIASSTALRHQRHHLSCGFPTTCTVCLIAEGSALRSAQARSSGYPLCSGPESIPCTLSTEPTLYVSLISTLLTPSGGRTCCQLPVAGTSRFFPVCRFAVTHCLSMKLRQLIEQFGASQDFNVHRSLERAAILRRPNVEK